MLWEIGMRVEVRRGETLFFQGNVILHNSQDITGSRNCVDLFIHQNVLTLKIRTANINGEGTRSGKIRGKRRTKDGFFVVFISLCLWIGYMMCFSA